MIEVGVVVLNYNNYGETIKCVNSILTQKQISVYVVVVDNGSQNQSYNELYHTFINIENVDVLRSLENLGYAQGNNIGIKHLREKGFEDIFVSNSDLFFKSEGILYDLVNNKEKGVGLVNPLIRNLNGTIDQRVSYKKRFLYLRMVKKYFEWLLEKEIALSGKSNDNSIETVKLIKGIQLDRYIVAGSGFLLTKDFFDIYNGLYPGTFLYYEEWATILLLSKACLKTQIVETDPIIHKGGASTPVDVKSRSQQRRKICKESWAAIFRLMVTPSWIAKRLY